MPRSKGSRGGKPKKKKRSGGGTRGKKRASRKADDEVAAAGPVLTVAGTDLFRVAPRQVMERTVADDGGGAGAAAAGNATGTLAPNTAVENQAVVLLVHAVQRFVPTALFPQLTGVDLPGMHAMAGRGAGGGLEAANAVPEWTEVFPGWHDQSAYDLTLSDGTHLAKVLIDPRLNRLINAGALQEGALVEVRSP